VCLQVQFGSNAAAAEVFLQACSSIGSLAAAWPELWQLLMGQQEITAGSSSSSAEDVSNITPGSVAAEGFECSEQQLQQQQQLVQLYTVKAELEDLHAAALDGTNPVTNPLQKQQQPQQQQQQQQQRSSLAVATATADAAPERQPLDASTLATASSDTATTSPAVSPVKDLVLYDQRDSLTTSDTAAAAAGLAANAGGLNDAIVPAAALPLPYVHYSLVAADGRPLERPDKHPFALTRVLYDAK
jgi:hypothetical protein